MNKKKRTNIQLNDIDEEVFNKFKDICKKNGITIGNILSEIFEYYSKRFIDDYNYNGRIPTLKTKPLKNKKLLLKCCGNCNHLDISRKGSDCIVGQYERMLSDMICSRWEG